jgi:hypothetical protein
LKQKVFRRNGKSGKKDARVTLWKDGKEKTHLVARLVAKTWCDGYADGLTVDHLDGNPENNNASNLEWVPLSENIRRGFENGLFPTQPIVVEIDGEQIQFKSKSAASRALGHTHGYLSNKLQRTKMRGRR